eukprot:GHVU01027905.1.p1 GENE.GHVU01027905.1~~GHVU01027905.1.p1  ORF type:complete len:165 (+),score=24.82 GHVU01027905.1:690-1184(+)
MCVCVCACVCLYVCMCVCIPRLVKTLQTSVAGTCGGLAPTKYGPYTSSKRRPRRRRRMEEWEEEEEEEEEEEGRMRQGETGESLQPEELRMNSRSSYLSAVSERVNVCVCECMYLCVRVCGAPMCAQRYVSKYGGGPTVGGDDDKWKWNGYVAALCGFMMSKWP